MSPVGALAMTSGGGPRGVHGGGGSGGRDEFAAGGPSPERPQWRQPSYHVEVGGAAVEASGVCTDAV
jgi:hypothetical protein